MICACLAVSLFAAPANEKGSPMKVAVKSPSWEARFHELLPALGHRNWVVIADAAFPLQISPGLEIIASGEDLLPVLDKVLAAIDKSKHIRPHVYLDKELAYVTEDLSPGADYFRRQLDERLKGRDVKPVLHEELLGRLDQVAKTFKILMIKTNLTIPYTSVFLELDCGYWPTAAEAKMREAMKADKR
jgi:D-ribose pyranose/furanose isomerase RbsD